MLQFSNDSNMLFVLQVRSLVGDHMSLLVQTSSAVTVAFSIALVVAWRLAFVIIAVQPLVVSCYYTKGFSSVL